MIELKPYRSIEISKDLKKEGKQRIAGRIKTSRVAYDERWSYSCLGTISIITLKLMTGLVIAAIIASLFISPGLFFASQALSLGFCAFEAVLICAAIGLLYGWFKLYTLIEESLKSVWRRRSSHYAMQPTMLVSYDHVPRGGTFEIVFRQPIPPDYVMDFSRVEVLSLETVTYVSRTVKIEGSYHDAIELDTDSHESLLKQDQVFDGIIPPDRVYEHRLIYTLPHTIMHSFALANNSLTWLIRVTLEYKGFTPLTETYAFQVTPEVHTL